MITGTGRGIGREMALEFAEQGADLVLISRAESELEEAAELIRANGRRALVNPAKVTDADSLRAAVARSSSRAATSHSCILSRPAAGCAPPRGHAWKPRRAC